MSKILKRGKHDLNSLRKDRNNKHNKIFIFFTLFFVVLLIISSYNLVQWFIDNKKSSKILDDISQYKSVIENDSNSSTTQSFSVDFDSLRKKNSTCFAWLVVRGTSIDYPIVKANNNDFYLTHSFDNSYNPAGWIFADYKNKCDGTDKNMVMYGHNRLNGSMFSTLKTILNKDWYTNKKNKIIKLYTPSGLIKYEVFSVYEIKVEDYYITTSFNSDSSFLKFLNDLKQRSIYDFGVELSSNDNILTLSTCSSINGYRTVLHARKIQAEI